MSKEVVYIDINDDITSVIEKIKQSKEKIVALVPPKQIGLLQSAVNLQLLARAAGNAGKYVVIITSKDSLMKLAAMAKIPVAKTLQSKPVLAKLPIYSAEDDTIDGKTMPIGELASGNREFSPEVSTDDVIVDPTKPIETGASAEKKKINIPKFANVRSKIILGVVGALLLVGVVLWAVIIAPRSVINIKTRTKLVNINQTISLTEDSLKASNEENIVHAQSQILEKTLSLEFAASGEKNIGERATGSVSFSNSSDKARTVVSGTRFTSAGGKVFTLNETVSVPAAGLTWCNGKPCADPSAAKGSVTAVEPGATYNGETGGLSGGPSGDFEAKLTAATSGGVDKIVKVVTQEDFDQAKAKLADGGNDTAVNELKNKFDASAVVVRESLRITAGEVVSSIEIGEEAPEGKFTVEQPVKYSMLAVVRNRIVDYLNFLVLKQEGDTKLKQKVYESGDDQIQFANFSAQDDKLSVKVITQMRIGPDIDVDEIKEFAQGKGYGEVKDRYELIEGIESVEVEFWPMWVRRVPKKADKILVNINLE